MDWVAIFANMGTALGFLMLGGLLLLAICGIYNMLMTIPCFARGIYYILRYCCPRRVYEYAVEKECVPRFDPETTPIQPSTHTNL